MKANLISLKAWTNRLSGSPKDQKEEAAELLSVGVATIYRWLKDGNIFLEESEDFHHDYGSIQIWEMKKTIEI